MPPTIPKYNLSEITNSTDNTFVKLLQYTSEQTNYFPGLAIMLIMYIIVFLTLKIRGYSTVAVFTASNTVALVLALLLFPLEIISGRIFVISIILLPLATFLMFVMK